MKRYVQNKIEARNLRKTGLSYSEIAAKLLVPKATIASWVQGVNLTEYQKTLLNNRLTVKQKRGRFMAGITLKARRVYREKVAYDHAEVDFKSFISDPFFTYGLGLYSGGALKDLTKLGRKNTSNFQFTTNDPDRALCMVKWIERFLKIGKEGINVRLFLYEPYREQKLEDFWSQKMAIPKDIFEKTIYSPKHYFFHKKPEYRGSIALTVSSIRVLRIVSAWQKLLIKYYKETLY